VITTTGGLSTWYGHKNPKASMDFCPAGPNSHFNGPCSVNGRLPTRGSDPEQFER